MARLIHLNGPPAVGKSTLAHRLVANRPGWLGLDVDVVVAVVGGWRDDFCATLPVARRLAAAMAREHLLAGHDVVLPQLVASAEGLAPYRAVVEDAGAAYVEGRPARRPGRDGGPLRRSRLGRWRSGGAAGG